MMTYDFEKSLTVRDWNFSPCPLSPLLKNIAKSQHARVFLPLVLTLSVSQTTVDTTARPFVHF